MIIELPQPRSWDDFEDLVMTSRGIVSIFGFDVRGGRLLKQPPDVTAATLRRLLTYWDRIDAPLPEVLPFDYDEDWGAVVAAGIGMRSPIPGTLFPGLVFEDTMLHSEAIAYAQHRQREPGAWTIAKTDTASGVWPGTTDTAAIAFELTKCITVPSPRVPIASILKFKEKRRDELYAFRVHMDELREKILAAVDREAVMRSVLDHVDKAIADIGRSMNEAFPTSILGRTTTLVAIGAQAGLGALAWGAHPVLGAAIGAGTLAIAVRTTKKPAGTPDGEPFAYIESVIGLDVADRT